MATAASSAIMPISGPGGTESNHDEGETQNVEGHTLNKNSGMRCTVSEIEEESSSDLFEIVQSRLVTVVPGKEDLFESSLFSYDIHRGGEVEEEQGCVYVVVGKDEWSMDALTWALRKIPVDAAVTITVYLVHVFPETHMIPSPLGNLPISSVSEEQVETYKSQEGFKRREMLQKFVNTCNASNVKVDTILIESDMVSKAILDLIPVLNIRRMVLGTDKSNLRRLRSKKGTEITEILQKTPGTCEIKIICDGKEVILDETIIESPTTIPCGSEEESEGMWQQQEEEKQCRDYFSCICFKPRTLN